MPHIGNDIALAVRHLRAGRLVAFPTETVYGLGGDAANRNAVAEIYRLKDRPAGHRLLSIYLILPMPMNGHRIFHRRRDDWRGDLCPAP